MNWDHSHETLTTIRFSIHIYFHLYGPFLILTPLFPVILNTVKGPCRVAWFLVSPPQFISHFLLLFPLRIRSYLRQLYDNAKNGPVVLETYFGCGLRFLLKVNVKVKVKLSSR